jgi:hypothetical protein
MKQRIWWTLHKWQVPQDTLCDLGLHHFTNKNVGLLHAHCGNCKQRVQVADPYSYTPSLGRNKYDENGFLTYD